ncbi:MAG: rhomboid family intramembrane serine protease [Opitutaceae bacterium]
MSAHRRFLRLLESFAIPNISLYLVIGQVAVFGLELAGKKSVLPILLVPAYVLQGEWWRVFTFVFVPPDAHPVFIAFAWYLFWMMGSALEASWGVGRYNLYLLIGWLLAVAVSFLAPPFSIASNAFIAGSVFLAFAWLAPNFELAIFFVLPVKIKWLALITWLFYGYTLLDGSSTERLGVLASTGNFLLFFAKDIWLTMRQHKRRMGRDAQRRREDAGTTPLHRCKICGKDSNTHPEMDFRYCSKCADDSCYCPDHIRDHEHVTAAEEKTHPPAHG